MFMYIYIYEYIYIYIYRFVSSSFGWGTAADQRGHRGGQLPLGSHWWRHALQFDHQAEQRGPAEVMGFSG